MKVSDQMGFRGDTRHLRMDLADRLSAMCEGNELNAGLGMLRGDDERCRTNGRILGERRLALTSVNFSFVVEVPVEMG